MLVLAVVDCLFLVSSLLTFSLPHLSSQFSARVWFYVVPFSLPIAQTCLTASVYMTISLTLERYFSVVHPLYQLSHGWLRSPALLSLPGIIFAVLFTLPNYFQLKTVMETSVTEFDNNTHSDQVPKQRAVKLKIYPNIFLSEIWRNCQAFKSRFA